MIRFENVSKYYGGDRPAVQSLNLEVAPGEFAVLIGPSGCGKSTTVALVNRLIEPSMGAVVVDGRDVAEQEPVGLRRKIGFVFQGIGLFPHLTVAENIGITPRLLEWASERIEARVRELLGLVRLPQAYSARLPRELSGGEQQRVGLARALAAGPKIMLMDEPFGALDPLVRDDLSTDYRAIHDELGLTTILVTHDMTEALVLADMIVVMREGRLVQRDTPRNLLSCPAGDFVRAMMESPRRRAERLQQVLIAGARP